MGTSPGIGGLTGANSVSIFVVLATMIAQMPRVGKCGLGLGDHSEPRPVVVAEASPPRLLQHLDGARLRPEAQPEGTPLILTQGPGDGAAGECSHTDGSSHPSPGGQLHLRGA